jgi:hypothetical protein
MTSHLAGFSLIPLTFVMALSTPAYGGTKCTMTFTLSGWSAFYKTASGSGTIRCSNGTSARVALSIKGGGVTFGKSRFEGIGTFSEVDSINALYGSYASASAEAGAGKSADATVVTKGTISLALSGKGRGIDLGLAFGNFRISKVGTRRPAHHHAH